MKLYKQRPFGEKINAVFSFLRGNAGPYFKAMFAISGPIAILTAVMYFILFQTLLEMGATQPTTTDYFFSTEYFVNLGGTALLGLLLVISIGLVNFGYMKLYHKNQEDQPSLGQVWSEVRKYLLKALGLYIIASILTYLGLFLLFIPGIYVAVTMSLTVPIMLNDNKGVFGSIGRAFDLIKGKWWSTFGLLFVTGIVGLILSYIVMLPAFLVMGFEGWMSVDQQGAVDENPFVWSVGLLAILGYLGNIIATSIVLLAVGFQYYNLVEKKESRGLMEEIEGVSETEPTNRANEGEY